LKVLQGDEEVTRWAKQLVRTSEEVDALDGEAFYTNIKSHLNVALLELEDDSVCISSSEKSVLLEDYLFKLWLSFVCKKTLFVLYIYAFQPLLCVLYFHSLRLLGRVLEERLFAIGFCRPPPRVETFGLFGL
jgi:hypothetical protein